MKFNFMITLFFLMLCMSCKEHHEDKTIAEDVTPKDLATVSRTLAGQQQKFSELPPLAHYINELVFWEDESFAPPKERLKLKNHHVIFDEEFETTLDTFSMAFAQFKGGWSGTSASEDWTTSYTLLDDGLTPTVLITRQSIEEFRPDYEDYMKEREALEDALEDAGIQETKILEIANKMAERDAMGNPHSLYGRDIDHRLSFWVWQKKSGQWTNISKEVFPSNMAEQLNSHFPFFGTDFEVTENQPKGFYLVEKTFPKPALLANTANWLNWFGIKHLSDLNLKLAMEGEDILLHCSKNKAIRWEWDGSTYTLKELPGKVDWMNNPCSKINLKTGGDYTFKGKIGEENEIAMQANITSKGKDIMITGQYWYLSQPDSKFPIEGKLQPEADKPIKFYRMKASKKRESFDAYFTNCRIEGYWQHLDNMNIEKFYLDINI